MLKLWGRTNSTNVKKALWCLEELGVPYTRIDAGGAFGVVDEPDYAAKNPNRLVPCLEDGELVLWESNAIVRYLAAQYGQKRLWVEAPAARAVGEKWMDWANQTLSPAHRVILFGLVRTPADQRDMAAIEASIQVCDNLFAILDNALADQPWFSGAEFGTADIAIAPFVYNLFNVGLTWTPRPHLERWYQQLTERPAFQKVVMIPVS